MEQPNPLRPLAESDRPAIEAAVVAAWNQAKQHKSWLSQYTLDDLGFIVDAIYDPANMTAVIVEETFLLGFTVSTPGTASTRSCSRSSCCA